MPQSLSNVLLHVVFSTKDRRPLISADLKPKLHAYLAGVARKRECECYRVGGVEDHVHLAIRLSRTMTVAKLIEDLKTTSSTWAKSQVPNFYWQSGYGAFSVNPTERNSLLAYIDNQELHHREVTFEEEYRELLREFGVEFDERYVWD